MRLKNFEIFSSSSQKDTRAKSNKNSSPNVVLHYDSFIITSNLCLPLVERFVHGGKSCEDEKKGNYEYLKAL